MYHVLALHTGLEQFQRVELPDALRLPPSVRKSGRTSAPRLDVGQPDIVAPLLRADRDRMAACMIGAVDQDAAKAPSRAVRRR
jgi:hypothetical protein